jgi:transposase
MRGIKQREESTGRMKKHRYSSEFKVTAVRLASHPGIQTREVAAALNIHPFMLSRWKREYREGKLKGAAHPNLKEIQGMEAAVSEHQRIRELEAALKKARIENELLKKAIQFNLERSGRSSRS